MQYFFILGHNPTLSTAEIVNVLPIPANELRIIDFSEEILILETENKIDVQKLQKKLGGTIKIGEIISEKINFNKNLLDLIIEQLPKNKKIYFGFSVYLLGHLVNGKKLMSQIKRTAMEVKTILKEQNISSRWVSSKERVLSSVIVQKNKLLTQGAEFCFFIGERDVYLGKTLTCQEFEEYEFYDFARPARSIEQGMLPPKLAKIMINLAFKGRTPTEVRGATLLDPFCGSGTILQEAVRLGYQNIIGTDISDEAVENAKKNMEWLIQRLNIKNKISKTQTKNIKIFKCDAREVSREIQENSIEAIVTEPYLGPIKVSSYKLPAWRRGRQVSSLISELSKLYLAAFREFKKLLEQNGRVVIIFPVFQVGKERHFLPILDEIKKQDWQVINPIPESLRKNPVIKLTPRDSVIYSRPGQKILREIFIFNR